MLNCHFLDKPHKIQDLCIQIAGSAHGTFTTFAHELKYNRSVNIHGGKGGNVPGDLALEFMNMRAKDALSALQFMGKSGKSAMS
jgi:hypothetical protein